MSIIRLVTAVLLVVGGLNWGLIGIFHINIVALLFGMDTVVSRTIYSLVGISALFQAAVYLPKEFRRFYSLDLGTQKLHKV